MSGAATYLDYNATAPVLPAAVAAMTEVLGEVGNPSSVHACGRRARARLEDAREAVGRLVGAGAAQVVFTSGGTEAAALALHGFACPAEGPVLVSATEHPCVLESVPEAERIPVSPDGVVDLDWLAARLERGPRPSVVAVMLANNETGVLQPVAEVAALLDRSGARAAGTRLFCDAVQGAGKIAVDLAALGVDGLAVSAHKMGGPQGVGALVLGAASVASLVALVRGGGQERGRRGGTPNLPGIVGFGAAAASDAKPVEALHQRLETGIRAAVPGAVIWGAGADRLPNTTCVGLPGVDQQRQIMALDLVGVAISAGSACSSGKVAPSHVLTAMGATPEQAREAVRVSLGWGTTVEDIDRFLAAWTRLGLRAAE